MLIFYAIILLSTLYFDWRYHIIPDFITYPSMGLVAFWVLANPTQSLWVALFGGLVGVIIPWLAYLISKDCIGLGDLKLGALVGLMVGCPRIFLVWMLSIMLAGLVGSAILLLRKKEIIGYIAFGPYICLATIGVLLST